MAQWRPIMKSLRITAQRPTIDLAATRAAIPADMQAGSAERTRLYHSARWQHARRRFLTEHPLCVLCEITGFVVAAIAVDHRDGHRRADWRARFWNEATWQPLCRDCHNRKSAQELADWQRIGMDPGDTTRGGRGV